MSQSRALRRRLSRGNSHARRPSSLRDPRTPSSEHLRSPQLSVPLRAPTPASLARLRTAVLEHLSDLETRLSQLEPPLCALRAERTPDPALEPHPHPHHPPSTVSRHQRSTSFSTGAIDDARARIRDGLDMLARIRSDVRAHLPAVRAHIPAFDRLPATPAVAVDKFELPAFDFDFDRALEVYLPTLSAHLDTLHAHLLALPLPSSLPFTPAPSGLIAELLHTLRDPDLLTDPLKSPLGFLADSRQFDFAVDGDKACEDQICAALIKARGGSRLIGFWDLPRRYQNNEFVLTGYRFIPITHWPRLLLSIFQLHNETANIWTHLLPLSLSLFSLSSSLAPLLHPALSPLTRLFPALSPLTAALTQPPPLSLSTPPPAFTDPAPALFTLFANICLASSCIWHVMAGCATRKAMETAARVDYVGIGWLISASIGTVVRYGFSCRPHTALLYLSVSFALGVAGSVLPFMTWFNERENKKWRIAFFLSLVFTLIFPLGHLAAVYSLWDMYTFIRPLFPSLASYALGLLFYAFRFPECAVPRAWGWGRALDCVGGGSHALWHLFIVFAIKMHKDAMGQFTTGIGNEVCRFGWGGA